MANTYNSELQDGVADALFSWAAWPWGNQDMNTFVDASYLSYLGSKPYMMPVSPWFYTNLPGFNKNWLWVCVSHPLHIYKCSSQIFKFCANLCITIAW